MANAQDPTVAKQWDNETSLEESFEQFAKIADGLKVCLMGSFRNGVGPVARAMAVAKRSGPDFLFLANANSQKFDDLEKNKVATVYFHNSDNQDWISVTGEAVTTDNSDPRIKEIWSRMVSVWFGDSGDGVHNGKPEDPRMKLIEVKAKYISYWQHKVGGVGFAAEITKALASGNVPDTGYLRQFTGAQIEELRSKHGSMSSK